MAEGPSILHADLDAFYASVEQLLNPELRGRPIAVGGGVVLAASYEAKRFGVSGGMTGLRTNVSWDTGWEQPVQAADWHPVAGDTPLQPPQIIPRSRRKPGSPSCPSSRKSQRPSQLTSNLPPLSNLRLLRNQLLFKIRLPWISPLLLGNQFLRNLLRCLSRNLSRKLQRHLLWRRLL